MFFHDKGIDKVKLTSILHNKLVRSKIPIYFQEQDPPLVSYKYTNTISRSVFNYNQTLRNINLNDYHNASSSCDCQSSTFIMSSMILTKAVDDYGRDWSKREGCHMSALEAWLQTVKLIISNRISNLEHRSYRPCHKV